LDIYSIRFTMHGPTYIKKIVMTFYNIRIIVIHKKYVTFMALHVMTK